MQFVPSSNESLHRRFFVGVAVVLVALFASAMAFASGWPPWVRDDYATVAQGGTVSILENGARSVLANDWDFERDPAIFPAVPNSDNKSADGSEIDIGLSYRFSDDVELSVDLESLSSDNTDPRYAYDVDRIEFGVEWRLL